MPFAHLILIHFKYAVGIAGAATVLGIEIATLQQQHLQYTRRLNYLRFHGT